MIVMKLGMYILCRNSSDSSVQAFALDHINDVVVNSVGLAGEPRLLPQLPILLCSVHNMHTWKAVCLANNL